MPPGIPGGYPAGIPAGIPVGYFQRGIHMDSQKSTWIPKNPHEFLK